MAISSSMLATIRTVPLQWTQVVMSTPNTRLSRCTQLIARRLSSVGAGLNRHDGGTSAPAWLALSSVLSVLERYWV
jgi:hypothetical protein